MGLAGRHPIRALLLCAFLLLALAPAAAQGRALVKTSPHLNLRFADEVSDYTTTCAEGSVEVDVDAPRGTRVGVDGADPRRGTYSVNVALGANEAFRIDVERGDRRAVRHWVRCLPEDFPTFRFTRVREPLAKLYASAPSLFEPTADGSYATIFNSDGTPIWWYRSSANATDVKAVSEGVIGWSHIAGGESNAGYELHKPNGRLIDRVQTVGTPTDGHELQRLANGNSMVMSYKLRRHVDLSAYGGPSDANVFDDEIQEVTPEGNVVWSWNSGDHIRLEETGRWWPNVIASPESRGGETVYDIVHGNSIEIDGKLMIISLRHTDAVYAIRRSTGRVVWKLGGTERPRSLDVRRDELGAQPLGGQHDARILPDGTLTVHDNGTFLGRAPRAVRYEIDRGAGTATLVEEVTDPRADSSICCGSSRRYAKGGWLLNWGSLHYTTEFDAEGRRTFRVDYGGQFSYRAVRIPSGYLTVRSLRHGMNVMAENAPPPVATTTGPQRLSYP